MKYENTIICIHNMQRIKPEEAAMKGEHAARAAFDREGRCRTPGCECASEEVKLYSHKGRCLAPGKCCGDPLIWDWEDILDAVLELPNYSPVYVSYRKGWDFKFVCFHQLCAVFEYASAQQTIGWSGLNNPINKGVRQLSAYSPENAVEEGFYVRSILPLIRACCAQTRKKCGNTNCDRCSESERDRFLRFLRQWGGIKKFTRVGWPPHPDNVESEHVFSLGV